MENYNKALRDKKELEKKLSLYEKEHKTTVNIIDMERHDLEGGLLDVQSKTTNLTVTVNSIAGTLKERRKKLQEKLKTLQQKKAHPQTYRRGNREVIEAELNRQEQELLRQLEVNTMKLELITGQKQLPEVSKTTNVISLLSKKKGFGAMLSNIRKNKESTLPPVRAKTPKPDFESPRNLSELILEFHKLPKIYPAKPKKKKPEATTVFLEQYEERRKKRELAMNYGTRTRIKRAQFHCDLLTGLYVPTKELKRKPSQLAVSTQPGAGAASLKKRAVTQ